MKDGSTVRIFISYRRSGGFDFAQTIESRLAFYKKNGFAPTGFTSYEDDMTYTVLATKIPFDAAAFMEGVARATGGLLRPDMRS
jgi:hypothetical protein